MTLVVSLSCKILMLWNSALKHGDECTYNGTDFLVLNKETGLVDEVNIAADMLNLLHAMGMRSVPL